MTGKNEKVPDLLQCYNLAHRPARKSELVKPVTGKIQTGYLLTQAKHLQHCQRVRSDSRIG